MLTPVLKQQCLQISRDSNSPDLPAIGATDGNHAISDRGGAGSFGLRPTCPSGQANHHYRLNVRVIAAFPDGGHQLGYLVVNSASRRRSAASVTNRCLLDQLGSASRLKLKGFSLGSECLA